MMYPELVKFIAARLNEFDQIAGERKQMLNLLAEFVGRCVSKNQDCKLVFVCTHNSRRSHFAQAWAQVAAAHFQIPGVQCFSGGTEATAFNPRTVAALRRAGFEIASVDNESTSANPRYLVRFDSTGDAVQYFSKRIDDNPNPQTDFAAIMTCSEADSACPMVRGCSFRLALPFNDPKVADGTAEESATYDERCRQVAREMLYTMFRVQRA